MIQQIISLLEYVDQHQWMVSCFFILLSLFFGLKTAASKIMAQIYSTSLSWIKELESNTEIEPAEKMDLVVGYIKDLIPRLFHVIFSDKVINSISESIYEDMRKYSENRVYRKTGLTWDQLLQKVKEDDKDNETKETLEKCIEILTKNSDFAKLDPDIAKLLLLSKDKEKEEEGKKVLEEIISDYEDEDELMNEFVFMGREGK